MAGFNPCFSGFGVIITDFETADITFDGFNPCFSGFGVIMFSTNVKRR